MAEYHFRRSLLINQRSSVLRCYVGVALHKIGRAQDALDQLQVSDDYILALLSTSKHASVRCPGNHVVIML